MNQEIELNRGQSFSTCFLEALRKTLDENIIKQYYLSNPLVLAYIRKLNTISDVESVNEDTINSLYSLVETFKVSTDLELVSETKGTCDNISVSSQCFISGFGFENKTYKSLNLEIARLLEVYLLNNQIDLTASIVYSEETTEYLKVYKEHAYLWNYTYKNSFSKSKFALKNSQLCLARAQEVVFLNKETEELIKLKSKNQCDFSILSMLAYGVYKLYDSPNTSLSDLSKSNFYNALAYYYYLKSKQTKKELNKKQIFNILTYILEKLKLVGGSTHFVQLEELRKNCQKTIKEVLRTHGEIELDNTITCQELPHIISVTLMRPSILVNSLANTKNCIPYYIYFESLQLIKIKENKLSKKYQNLVDCNLKNLIQLIMDLRCQNVITFNQEISVPDFKQIEEVMNKIGPSKRKLIKSNMIGNPNLQAVVETSNFLKIGFNIDRDNEELWKNLKKEVVLQKPVLSSSKLIKRLRGDKGYKDELVVKLVCFLNTLNNYLKILMNLKTPSKMTFSIYLDQKYNDNSKYDQNFNYEDSYKQYIKVEYKDKFENTLQQIKDFILKESKNSNSVPNKFKPEDLIDQEILTFNEQINLYKILKNNIMEELKLYAEIEKSFENQ